MRSLADVIAFNEREKAREMPYFGQEMFVMAEKKGPLTSPAYLAALATCQARARTQGIDAVMTQLPARRARRADRKPGVADRSRERRPLPRRQLDAGGGGGISRITVPAGFSNSLPIGISFMGRPWSEARLIALAYAFEQATRHRAPPAFLPTLRLDNGAAR